MACSLECFTVILTIEWSRFLQLQLLKTHRFCSNAEVMEHMQEFRRHLISSLCVQIGGEAIDGNGASSLNNQNQHNKYIVIQSQKILSFKKHSKSTIIAKTVYIALEVTLIYMQQLSKHAGFISSTQSCN